MTDYGRGSGSEPWHPEDPLYGDQGWAAQQASDGHAPQGGGPQQSYGQQGQPQGPYGAGHDPYQQQYPQQAQQQVYDAGQYPQYPGDPYPQQQYPEQQYPDQQQYGQQQYPQQQGHVPGPRYGGEGHGGDGQGYGPGYGQQPGAQRPQQGYAQQPAGAGYPGHEQYPTQGPGPGYDPQGQGPGYDPQGPGPGYDPQYGGGGWDTGAQQTVGYQDQGGGYGSPGPAPHDPGHGSAADGGYPGDGRQQEEYGAPAGQQPYQPPAPQPSAPQVPRQGRASRQEPQDPGWDDDPPEETHPFFTGEDTPLPGRGREGRGARSGDGDAGLSALNEDDDYDDLDDGDAPGGTGKKRKGRSGAACLVIAVVLVGGVGGAGYFGYTFYQDRFGPPPDYAGSGTGTVQVTVPDGANGSDIAALLMKSGVIKSAGAFVTAQNANAKGNTIQAGVYTLKKQMSGKSAVALMLSPNSRNALIIPEGTRDAAIYALIDKRLQLKAGTTRSIASDDLKNLGLPDWADDSKDIKDPLEGFLFPASYPVGKDSKPEDVLKVMVARANAEYDKYGLQTKAKSVGLDNPWQLLTVASLVQAEGKTQDDFRKMAEVVYNRLKLTNYQTNQKLEFDSTYNYLKGQSHIHISLAEVRSNHDPYNTYTQKGLPPGPIGNPGEEALAAAMSPTHDGWLYFVATDGDNKTEFAKTYGEFQQLKQKFDNSAGGLGG